MRVRLRPCRFAPLFTLAVASILLSACMHRPQGTVVRDDLDSFTYGRPAAIAAVPAPDSVPVDHATPVVSAYADDGAYRLDSGDKLRVVVFGQEGLTNTYTVDAAGAITIPLIGPVPARGQTPRELAGLIAAKLRKGYIREPHVAAEIESYRPFFILGEVAAPGQYPFVPDMTVEKAVAIAGGFSPRARRGTVDLTRMTSEGPVKAAMPLTTLLKPGDTITVGERWF